MFAVILAQAADQPPPFWANPMFMFMILGLFMVTMVWLPARRQRREQEAMLAALKPGAKVVTTSGIVGTIIKLKEGEDELTLRSEDTKLRVLRSTVARVLGTDESETK